MSSDYVFRTARGGKHDESIEQALQHLWHILEQGGKVGVSLSEMPAWEGKDRVDIQSGCARFLNRDDHTFSPVAIKAAVRVLHKKGLCGVFLITVSGRNLTVEPSSGTGIGARSGSSTMTSGVSPDVDGAGHLWWRTLADPVPLLRTAPGERLVAIFDDKGFFLSQQAIVLYDQAKNLPHVYAARLMSGDCLYFGISLQAGGRWKRSHAYHLGGMAYEILGTTRYDDQDHSHWVKAWFEPFEHQGRDGFYAILMKEVIVVSFFVPHAQADKSLLERIESGLISSAVSKGLTVLNKKR